MKTTKLKIKVQDRDMTMQKLKKGLRLLLTRYYNRDKWDPRDKIRISTREAHISEFVISIDKASYYNNTYNLLLYINDASYWNTNQLTKVKTPISSIGGYIDNIDTTIEIFAKNIMEFVPLKNFPRNTALYIYLDEYADTPTENYISKTVNRGNLHDLYNSIIDDIMNYNPIDYYISIRINKITTLYQMTMDFAIDIYGTYNVSSQNDLIYGINVIMGDTFSDSINRPDWYNDVVYLTDKENIDTFVYDYFKFVSECVANILSNQDTIMILVSKRKR